MPRPALCCTPPDDGVTNPARAHDKRDQKLVAGKVMWAKLTQPQQDAVLLAARKGHEGALPAEKLDEGGARTTRTGAWTSGTS